MNAEQMYKMCFHKKKYRTLNYAIKVAKELTEKFGKRQYVYLCPLCLNYHMTTHKQEGTKYENEE